MKLEVKPGKYVVAVSGGVDSVVLLDLLAGQKGLDLVVAHYDHGIRDDSRIDRQFVATLSQKYGLPFEFGEGKLGVGASEDAARQARYDFLRQICKKYQAKAIITAHHQDDMLETLIVNVLRGTKRSGLASLKSTQDIVRPLLHLPKTELLDYARAHHLEWHEDSTNADDTYRRNWVRLRIVPHLTAQQRSSLLTIQTHTTDLNRQIGVLLAFVMGDTGERLDRQQFANLPHDVAAEVMAAWLRQNGIRDFDNKTIQRLVVSAKTAKVHQTTDIRHGYAISITKAGLQLTKTSAKN